MSSLAQVGHNSNLKLSGHHRSASRPSSLATRSPLYPFDLSCIREEARGEFGGSAGANHTREKVQWVTFIGAFYEFD